VSHLKNVVAHAELLRDSEELRRIHSLLEDRAGLAEQIRIAIHEWDRNLEVQKKFAHSEFVADRITSYLRQEKK